MKIIKYNAGTDKNGTTIIYNGSSVSSGASVGSSESADKLKETHLIWGQPFDGTQDVSGDLTNVLNIISEGGDITVKSKDEDGETYGGNIFADGNVTATKFIGDVDAKTINADSGNIKEISSQKGEITNLSGDTLTYIGANLKLAIIDTLKATDITTENLTVTKSAHFFELIIDKIKSIGGSIILSPADGFKVDKVTYQDDACRLLWKASDGDRRISNMWRVNDLAICQTFNAAEGTSYNISNKYYWALVTGVGTETIGEEDFHYIDLSYTIVDGTLNPEIGDEVVMLGYRGDDDESRQSAIYMSSYNSIDSDLVAPLFCEYRGINDFNLKSHKYTWFAANGNTIKGNLKVESGLSVEEIIDDKAKIYIHTAYADSLDGSLNFSKTYFEDALYMGMCSNTTESDEDLTYSDYIWVRIKGLDIEIQSSNITYAVTDDGVLPDDSAFIYYSFPSVKLGQYLWIKTVVEYSDGTITKSYSVSRIGTDGKEGDKGNSAYLHIAYANSSDGSLDFSLTYFDGAKYIGTYSDEVAEDSTDYTKYTWARLKGENGDAVTIVSTEVRYAVTSTNVLPSDSYFTYTSIPSVNEGYYLWSRTTITYSDGTVVKTYSVSRVGADGVGEAAQYYKLLPVTEKASVNSDSELAVYFKYQIVHVDGATQTVITASSSGYHIVVMADNSTTKYNLSYSSTPYYRNDTFMTDYHTSSNKPIYFTAYLYDAANTIVDLRVIPVIFEAGATLTVTDKITATVASNKTELDGKILEVSNNVSAIQLTAELIKSTVEEHTTSIDTLNGLVESQNSKISEIKQTADLISSSVSDLTENVNGNTLEISSIKQRADEITSSVLDLSDTVDGYSLKISLIEQTAEGITSTVSSLQETVDGHTESISQISQKADLIELAVNDTNIRIDNYKIELNGDTVVNGNLTLTDSSLGFVLQGDSGTTVISPLSVGEYEDFINSTNSNIYCNFNASSSGVNSSNGDLYVSWIKNFNLGVVPANSYIRLCNPTAMFMSSSGTLLTPKSGKIIFKFTSTYTDGSGSFDRQYTMDYTNLSQLGQVYYFMVYNEVNVTLLISTSNIVIPAASAPSNKIVNLNLTSYVEVPNDAYALLGYDGLGLSYGTTSHLFCNSKGTWIRYGVHGLSVQTGGLFYYNTSSGWTTFNPSNSSSGGSSNGCTLINIGNNSYTPTNGVITLPAYPVVPSWCTDSTKYLYGVTINGITYNASGTGSTINLGSGFVKSITANGSELSVGSTGAVAIGAMVRTINFNNTNYIPNSSGVINITTPAYCNSILIGNNTYNSSSSGVIDLSNPFSNIDTSNCIKNDVTSELTIKGDLRLKGSGNYGSTLKFGDESYCYISESSDDDMKIYADSVDIVTKNGAEVKVDGNTSSSTVYLTANTINTSAKVSTFDNKGSLNLNGNSVNVNDWFSVGLKNLQSSDAITLFSKEFVLNRGVFLDSMNNGVNLAINVFGEDAANSYYIDGNIGYKVCSNGNMIIRPSSTTDESTSYALTVKGNVSVSGTVTESSDERLKDKIDDKIYSVEDFANAPLFTYTWILPVLELSNNTIDVNGKEYTINSTLADSEVHLGTTAQYWIDKIPEVVNGSEDTTYSVEYNKLSMAGAITNAREVVDLKNRVKELENLNKELLSRLELLEIKLNTLLNG